MMTSFWLAQQFITLRQASLSKALGSLSGSALQATILDFTVMDNTFCYGLNIVAATDFLCMKMDVQRRQSYAKGCMHPDQAYVKDGRVAASC